MVSANTLTQHRVWIVLRVFSPLFADIQSDSNRCSTKHSVYLSHECVYVFVSPRKQDSQPLSIPLKCLVFAEWNNFCSSLRYVHYAPFNREHYRQGMLHIYIRIVYICFCIIHDPFFNTVRSTNSFEWRDMQFKSFNVLHIIQLNISAVFNQLHGTDLVAAYTHISFCTLTVALFMYRLHVLVCTFNCLNIHTLDMVHGYSQRG